MYITANRWKRAVCRRHPVQKSVTVTKANQTIVTSAGGSTLANITKDNGDFAFVPAVKSVDANGADTNLTLSYSSGTTSVITVNGNKLQPAGVGTSTITVSQSGNNQYNPATSKSFTVTVTEKTPYTDSFAWLTMWLNGKDINGDGTSDTSNDFLAEGKISSWADKSGNSNTMTQGTSANQPVWISTGGGISLSDSDFLTGSNPLTLTGNPNFTLLLVAESSSSNGRLFTIGHGSQSTYALRFQDNGSLGYKLLNSSSLQAGSYSFNTLKSIGVWKRLADSNFNKGQFRLNGSDKGLTHSGETDASNFSIISHNEGLSIGRGSGNA